MGSEADRIRGGRPAGGMPVRRSFVLREPSFDEEDNREKDVDSTYRAGI